MFVKSLYDVAYISIYLCINNPKCENRYMLYVRPASDLFLLTMNGTGPRGSYVLASTILPTAILLYE